MATQTLRPNGTLAGPGVPVVSAANAHAATSDNSDASYVNGASDNMSWRLTLGDISFPSGGIMKTYQIRARVRESGGEGDFQVELDPSGTYYPGLTEATASKITQAAGVTTSFQTFSGALRSVSFSDSQVDGLGLLVSGWSVQVAEIYLDVVVAEQPLTATWVAPSGNVTNTRRPLIDWTFRPGADGPTSQSKFRVKIFSAAQYGAGGFNPDTSAATLDSGNVASSSTAWTPTSSLANGTTYRAYVRTYTSVNGTEQVDAAWSFITFTIAIPVPTPTSVTPANSTTVTSSRPAVGASVAAMADGVTLKRQWQIASNTGFSTNLQTITETTLATSKSGTYAFPAALNRLPQGVWYVRARTLDEYGNAGSYSATNTFTVAHAPSTSNRQPSGGVSLEYDSGNNDLDVSWTFSDIDTTDFQLKYEAELWKLSDPVASLKTTGEITSSLQTATFTGLDASWKDTELRWRVRVADQDSVWSAWSGEQALYLRDLPTATITSPTNNEEILTSTPLITWSFSATAGRTQASWRVIIVDTTAAPDQVVADSGIVTGDATQWQVPSPVILVGPTYTVQVILVDTSGLSNSDTNTFTSDYLAPSTPTFTVDGTDYPDEGRVGLDWSGATSDPTHLFWRVYRRIEGSNEWMLIADELNQVTYDDYLAPADTPLEYSVVQVAESFGAPVESPYPIETFWMVNEHYFLICPDNTALNMRLYNVTADSFSDEQEMSSINLIGRGRRVEYGTRFGQSGSLTAQLRDNPWITARGQRLAIELLRNSQLQVYLRNPFGDVWAVALNSAQFTRIAGVGLQEAVDVTIEYSEITG